ncbi:MAG: hypothetical protein JST54_04640 [Deltaproteobacteria bacterium]|nr:hypothetical protein [Deltaproteobacteria bacterium]
MRALIGALLLTLAGCTLQYTDENAAKSEVPRADGGSGSTTAGSTGSTGTSSTTEGTTTGTSTSTNATSTSTTGTSTQSSSTGTVSATSSTGGSTGSTSSTTSTSTTGTSGSSGAYSVLADGCPGNCGYVKDVVVTAPGTYVVLDDASELYQWNQGSSWVLKASPSGLPNAIAADANGDIWVSVAGNQEGYLIKVRLSDGSELLTVGDRYGEGHTDASLTASEFKDPFGIVIDGSGNLIVAEETNNDLRYVDISGNSVTTIAGSSSQQAGSLDSRNDGGGLSATFDDPRAIAMGPDGSVYIAEQGTSCRIRKMDNTPMHNVTTVAGSSCCAAGSGSDDSNPLNAVFCPLTGITVDASGNIFVTEQSTGLVREVSSAGVTTLGGGDTLTEPDGLRTDGANHLVVAVYGAIWQVTY